MNHLLALVATIYLLAATFASVQAFVSRDLARRRRQVTPAAAAALASVLHAAGAAGVFISGLTFYTWADAPWPLDVWAAATGLTTAYATVGTVHVYITELARRDRLVTS